MAIKFYNATELDQFALCNSIIIMVNGSDMILHISHNTSKDIHVWKQLFLIPQSLNIMYYNTSLNNQKSKFIRWQ